ncbi:COG4223 family protein [Yoonia sp.]|uniref:COG4223 family protein n=1 Tax=Yoonia sp. TaxID=2212373 RepID=UPI0039761953
MTAPTTDTTLPEQIAAQSSQISALEQRIAAMPEVDLSGIEATQSDLAAQLSDIAARVAELEERPAGSAVSQAAGEGVADEMDALRAQIAEMTNAAQTELAEARAQAASIEESAAAAARSAAARAAFARIQTALESGAPIGAALGDLEDALGESAPDALIAVQDGVPTLASLQDQFPDVARAALATARSEGVSGEETTGFGAFLRNQFDVRSTTPQEGNSADAILSRAEAAVRNGRLNDALAEISALPEVVRAEMSDWVAQAEARVDAIAAVDILSTSLSDN